jgi:hypothetical protein
MNKPYAKWRHMIVLPRGGNMLRSIIGTLIIVLQLVLNAAASEIAQEAQQEAARLVTMIHSTFPDGERVGAGIIFGYRADTLYIVTANHNVRWGEAEASKIEIRLRDRTEHPLKATLSAKFDGKLDLAVLSVEDVSKLRFDPATLSFDRLGNSHVIQRGALVYPMGNARRPWAMSVSPDEITEKEGDHLYFESNFINTGYSGGALWNESLDIVGMIRADQPPEGSAVKISSVLKRLTDWGFPVLISAEAKDIHFQSVATGTDIACGITTSDDIYCFGDVFGFSELGNGTNVGSNRLRRVLGGHRFRAVSVGEHHRCGLDVTGHGWCWGTNLFGGLDARPVGPPGSMGEIQTLVPVKAASVHLFKSLSISEATTCGLTPDGSVWCWGDSAGRRQYQSPHKINGSIPFVSLHMGAGRVCGLTGEGLAHCWELFQDELSTSNSMSVVPELGMVRFKTISLGGFGMSGCGITTTDEAVCWGTNSNGELGNGRGSIKPHTGLNDSDVPVRVAGKHAFTQISASRSHRCGLTPDGKAWCWGGNANGQLGDGTTIDRDVPVLTQHNQSFVYISVGDGRSCAVNNEGAMTCWGKLRGEIALNPMVVPGQGK